MTAHRNILDAHRTHVADHSVMRALIDGTPNAPLRAAMQASAATHPVPAMPAVDRDHCASCRCELGFGELGLCFDCHYGDDFRA